jgi:CheY-like chemotaxis protein
MHTQPVILLAEDDRNIRVMMTEALVDEGYDVLVCASGRQAIATLERATPSLLLTDLHMEGSDSGFEVVRHLRTDVRTQDVPAIIYSADSAALRHSAYECELHNAITIGKPFDIVLLLNMIADLLAADVR